MDGYNTEIEMEAACDEFIYEQLDLTAGSVSIKKIDDKKEEK